MVDPDWYWRACVTHRSSGVVWAWLLNRCGLAGRWWQEAQPAPEARVFPIARRLCCGVPENEPCAPGCPAEAAAALTMASAL